MTASQPLIRRALPEEADDLTALAVRSKAHWRYDAEFMKAAASTIGVSPASVRDDEVWVMERTGRLCGLYRVVLGDDDLAELEDLWLDPDAIGRGLGRQLFEHAVETARRRGRSALEWDADPNALGFYEAMGGEVVGETESTVQPGRMLPRMRLVVNSDRPGT